MCEISEWGQHSASDPDELVDLMIDLHPAQPVTCGLTPDPRPLHGQRMG